MTTKAIAYAAMVLTIVGGMALTVPAGAASLVDAGYNSRDATGPRTDRFAKAVVVDAAMAGGVDYIALRENAAHCSPYCS
ncbi:hypothetical protein ACMT1E_07470 [Sphingomonas flavalba]|uniref:hypothetical protein n=1 Tax=Sphingomonas flavalba TaxID=2559804 RepID=UPI0039E0EF10